MGAGYGIGKMLLKLFATQGCKIVATDVNKDAMDELMTQVIMSGSEMSIIMTNEKVKGDVDLLIDEAVSLYGTLDILVNNAEILEIFVLAGETNNQLHKNILKIKV